MQNWPYNCASLSMSFIKECIQVGQQSVANVQVILGGFHQDRIRSKHSRILGLKTNIGLLVFSSCRKLSAKHVKSGCCFREAEIQWCASARCLPSGWCDLRSCSSRLTVFCTALPSLPFCKEGIPGLAWVSSWRAVRCMLKGSQESV